MCVLLQYCDKLNMSIVAVLRRVQHVCCGSVVVSAVCGGFAAVLWPAQHFIRPAQHVFRPVQHVLRRECVVAVLWQVQCVLLQCCDECRLWRFCGVYAAAVLQQCCSEHQ